MLLLFVLLFVLVFQDQTAVDSLQNQLIRTSDPEGKAQLYNQLARTFYATDPDRSIAYTDSAFFQLEDSKLEKLRANVLNIRGVASLIKSDFESAMKSHVDALRIREQIQDTVGILESQLNIGNILYRTGSAREAAVRYRKALFYAKLSDNQRGQGLLYNNLGSYFRDLWAETKDPVDLDSAKYYLTEALTIKKSQNDLRGAINTLTQLSQIAREQGKLSQAAEILAQALEVSDDLNDLELQISLLSELSEFNLEQKNFSASLNYSLKAYDLAQSMNSLFQISSTAGLVASAYESIGDYKNAFLYTQTKLESIQELNQEQNKQITEDLLIKYESEKKDLQNQSLIKEQQLLDLEIKRKNELLLGTGIIVLGLIAGWILQSRKKKQLARAHAQTKELLNELKVKNEEIQIKAKDLQESNLALLESNRIRQRLFSVISHDLKAPLSSLNAILDIWGDQLISQEEFQNLVPKVSNQLGRVRGLMDNLLEWAQAELDHSHISYSEVRVAELIDLTVGHLSPLWQEKSLTISNQVSPSLVLETDKDRLSFVLRNLSLID